MNERPYANNVYACSEPTDTELREGGFQDVMERLRGVELLALSLRERLKGVLLSLFSQAPAKENEKTAATPARRGPPVIPTLRGGLVECASVLNECEELISRLESLVHLD